MWQGAGGDGSFPEPAFTRTGKPGSWASFSLNHPVSPQGHIRGRRTGHDGRGREKLYSTRRRRVVGENDLGPFLLNKPRGRERTVHGTEGEADQERGALLPAWN